MKRNDSLDEAAASSLEIAGRPDDMNSMTGRGSSDAFPPTPATLSRREFTQGLLLAAAGAALNGPAFAATGSESALPTLKPTLYLIATAHNDTQWNWTVQHTIRDCVPNTMYRNFALFEKYPDYKFNYEGVIHYMFFKEYHPDQWSRLQDYVKKGRWKVSGAWINAVDVNIPSAESLFRHALYGNGFFRREFGTVSRDVYLPDCFGFGYALPSIGRHSGLNAFSTQKLSWGSWIPAPFAVGRWEGVDGSFLVSALRCGSYTSRLRSDIATDPRWNSDLSDAGDTKVDLRYFGVGDQGGAPDPTSVEWAEKSMHDNSGPVRVRNTAADQMAKDLKPREIAALPHYKGELVMRTHGVGCYTSQAAMKKWNRANELLADTAERAAVIADWLGGPAYPREKLREAWIRVLWHQAHDDLTGTCIPQAYTFSWNDELIALNQFASALSTGGGAVAAGMDTSAEGIPLVVFNPLSWDRSDPVEATVVFPGGAPAAVRVFDTTTREEVPSQTLSTDGNSVRLLIFATLPSVAFKVYDVRPSETPCDMKTGLSINETSLENDRYRVRLDADGNVSSIFDKETQIEILRAPARLELFHDYSHRYPAWEILWATISNPPRAVVAGPKVRIAEQGPARVALEVTREADGSTFVQQIRLTAGGDRVEWDTHIDWKTPGTLVKAAFPMTAANPVATFDLGVGVIERPNADANLYEVPAQQWADLTDASGSHGMAIMNDCKYGWDKPSDNALRLTLIRTPDSGGSWKHQETNDIGHHHFVYAIAAHQGDWRRGEVPHRAARLNQPLVAFQSAPHPGRLGRSFSFLRVSTDQVAVRALKMAEESSEMVIRLQELQGQPADVEIEFAAPVSSVQEINASEERGPRARPERGRLAVSMAPYQPRTFAIRLRRAIHKVSGPKNSPVELPFDLDGISTDSARADGDFDGAGRTYPAELLPNSLTADGIVFKLGSGAPGSKNALSCKGQTIAIPHGRHNRLYLLAAAVGGDVEGPFKVQGGRSAGNPIPIKVQEWTGLIGQWDSRLAYDQPDGGTQVVTLGKDGKIEGLENLKPAFVKRDNLAWVGTHRHSPTENEPNIFCYLFKYRIDLPDGATAITLPDNDRIRVFAMTASRNSADDAVPAGDLCSL